MAQLDPALVPHHATGAGEKTFVTKAREHKRLVQGNLAALGSTVSSAGRSLLTSLSSLATPRAAFAMGGSGSGREESAGEALLGATGGDAAAMGVAMADLTVAEGGRKDDSAARAEPRVEALRLNGGRRFDFAIQEGVGESLNEYISGALSLSLRCRVVYVHMFIRPAARVDFIPQQITHTSTSTTAISSHACYFAHPDVAYFLVRLLHRLEETGNDIGDSAAPAASAAEEEVMRV